MQYLRGEKRIIKHIVTNIHWMKNRNGRQINQEGVDWE